MKLREKYSMDLEGYTTFVGDVIDRDNNLTDIILILSERVSTLEERTDELIKQMNEVLKHYE